MKNKLKLLICFSPFFVSSLASASWQLTFNDEFNGTKLDTTKWRTSFRWGDRTLPGNDELQCYADASISVNQGLAVLTASKKQTIGCSPITATSPATKVFNYASGLIDTLDSFSQKYGYFEIRTKLPKGAGLWPAFWLLPKTNHWPPEIDVFEFLQDDPTLQHSTYHYPTATGHLSDGFRAKVADSSANFHNYGIDWQPNLLIWYVDGVEIGRKHGTTVPNEAMYMLANLAVGGWAKAPLPSTVFPAKMEIEYIRAYKRVMDSVDTTNPPSNNLINNPGFESGNMGWNFYATAPATAALSSLLPYEGLNSAVITGTSIVTQRVPVQPNSTYEFSGTFKSNTAGKQVRLGAKNYGYPTISVSAFTGLQTYQKATMRFTTASGFAGAQTDVYLWEADGSGQVDNFSLTYVPTSANFIKNPNFDSGALNWTFAGATPAALSASSYEGDYGVLLSNGSEVAQIVTGLQPNTNYKLTAVVKSGDAASPVIVGVKSFDSLNTISSLSSAPLEFGTATIKFKTGPSSTSAKIFANNTRGLGYVDNFSVVYDDGNLLVNPSFESNEITGWSTGFPTGTTATLSYDAFYGTNALAVNGSGTVLQTVTGLKSNTTYAVTAYVKSLAGTAISVGAKNFGGTNTGASSSSISYQKVSFNFTTGAGVPGQSATIYAYNSQASNMIIDQFTLTKVP